jgi:hypothetical protein
MVSQRRISEQRRMVTIVCIFRERRNESSLPPPALPGCQKECARNQLRCDHNEPSDYFLIYPSQLVSAPARARRWAAFLAHRAADRGGDQDRRRDAMGRTVAAPRLHLVAGNQPVVGWFILGYDVPSLPVPAGENGWKGFHQLPPR